MSLPRRAAQISATVTEVAAATSKASCRRFPETTVTAEQVRQAARVSSEKAKKVATGGGGSVRSGQKGHR